MNANLNLQKSRSVSWVLITLVHLNFFIFAFHFRFAFIRVNPRLIFCNLRPCLAINNREAYDPRVFTTSKVGSLQNCQQPATHSLSPLLPRFVHTFQPLSAYITKGP